MRGQRHWLGLWLALAAIPDVAPARGLAEAAAQPDDFDEAPPAEASDRDALDPPSRGLRRQDVQALEEKAAVRRARASHQIMKQFMHNFARNMRYAILADSKGDMPEEERQRMLRQLQEGGADGTAGSDEDAQSAPVQSEFHSGHSHEHHHTLNMLNAHHHRAHHEVGTITMHHRAGEGRSHAAAQREHHYDSLVKRLHECKTKACIMALWDEAKQSRHLAAPHHAEMERSVEPVEKRGAGAAKQPREPPLLLFGNKEAESGDPPTAQAAAGSGRPSTGTAAAVGGVIGLACAVSAYVATTFMGP